MNSLQKQLSEVTSTEPCIHCGKGDWCYRFANSASVCNRGQIASGWEESGKSDKNGAAILYPIEWQKQKPKPKIITTQEWIYKDRNGDDLVKVTRQNLDDGSKKIFQSFWNGKRWLSKRPSSVVRADIPIYRYMEISAAVLEQKPIFIVEGEKVADKLIGMGFAATTNIQGAKNYSESDLGDLAGANRVILCPDKDAPGLALMKQWEKGLRGVGLEPEWLYAFPDTRWDNLPDSKGLDLFDWIVQFQLTRAELLDAIGVIPGGLKPKVETSTPLRDVSQYDESDTGEETEGTYNAPDLKPHVRAFNEIYGNGHYISVDDRLYGFNGKFYESLNEGEEIRKFRDWAARNPVLNPKSGRWELAHMSPEFLARAWKWTLTETAINPDRLNPPGINLANGVLRVSFKGKSATWRLDPHSPRDYFLSCSEVAYNPDANPEMAHRLLEALDPDPREVFLRTAAAAIDLQYCRKILGRGIRAALCRGSGANGKDSFKEAIALIFGGNQVASATLSDFVGYDQGRKFDLAQLRGVKFNWPSENNQKTALDKSDSLNCAITGDALIYELKGKQGEEFVCNAVHFFNCNQLPNLKAGLDSLKTRLCVLDFFKTYTQHPDPRRGELQADPRFKYDREFMIQDVCPGLLNLILAELNPLLSEGINYEAIEDSLQDIQEESTHLWEFCRDAEIVADPAGRVYVHDLWYRLQVWYEENGTLERVDKPDGGYKNVWHEQANKWDANITGPNQIFKRFKVLFPKIDKRRETSDPQFKGRFYLSGLSWNSASPASPPYSMGVSASPSASLCFTDTDSASPTHFSPDQEEVKQKVNQNQNLGEAETRSPSTGEAGEAKSEKLHAPENLTDEQRKEYLGHIDKLREELGWETSKLRAFCQFQTGKTKPSELSYNEAIYLWNALAEEAEKLKQ